MAKEREHVPALDLEDLAPDRKPVKFPGGNRYEIIHHNELGIRTLKGIQQRWEKVGEMLEAGEGDISSDEAEEIEAALIALVRILVPAAPPEAVENLTDTQKMAVVQDFYETVPASKRSEGERSEGASDDAAPLVTSGS